MKISHSEKQQKQRSDLKFTEKILPIIKNFNTGKYKLFNFIQKPLYGERHG
jgi:hypothetical protein